VCFARKKRSAAPGKHGAEEVGRWDRKTQTGDLVIIDKSARWRFNFLDWESSRPGEGGGLTINIVALLDEIAATLARGAKEEGGGDNKFFEDALHHMNTNLVDLPIFAGVPVTLPLLRTIANSAPLSMEEARSDKWLDGPGDCATVLRAADARTKEADEDTRADFEECKAYWLQEWPGLSERTRSIVQLMFSMLTRPLLTRPLRQLFSADTNVTPEDAFKGKVIIVDLPVQEFRLAGRVANLAWKYCMQVAIMRRVKPPNAYLRPVFIWADECQNFVSPFDTEYQAVARSAGGCTVYLTQTRESLRRVLGDSDTTDSLLANLQAKFFCQNTGDTNEWASKSVFGERWTDISGHTYTQQLEGQATSGINTNLQLRRYLDPSRFTVLKRGGPANNKKVEAILYNGGRQYPGMEDGRPVLVPYQFLTFDQE
jgi:hypothetical protein